MASRESYSLKQQWDRPTYNRHRHDRYYPALDTYNKFTQTSLRLKAMWYFTMKKFIHGDRYERKMFYTDNIKSPFNRLIGCRITGHNWFYIDEDNYAFCTKCHKRSSVYTSRMNWDRAQKLKQIKKRTKK